MIAHVCDINRQKSQLTDIHGKLQEFVELGQILQFRQHGCKNFKS